MDDNTFPSARGNGTEGSAHRTPGREPAEASPTDGVLRRAPDGETPNGASYGPPRRGPKHAAEEPDEFGAYHYDGDDESGRAPGSALVLVILSLVGGGLYFWQYLPLMRRFDWIRALTLETPAPFILGGAVVLVFGAILLLRYGMVWASRLACALILAPMLRLLVESIIESGFAWVGPAIVTLLISGGPVLLVVALSFSPALNRWRRRRQEYVKSRRNS
jgi:hypothetical protein